MRARFDLVAVGLACFTLGAACTHFPRARAEADSPHALLGQLARVLVLVENEYVDPVDRGRLLEGAIKGMVAELDPHSTYMPADDNAVFQGETDGHFGGVGVEVEVRDGAIIVLAPIEGGPAERAGVRSGDRIVAIDGAPTAGEKLDVLVKKMRGAPGTRVRVDVEREGQTGKRTIELSREQIKVSSVTWRRLADGVLYLRLKQFQATTHEELLRAISQARGAGPVRGALLDLRGNPGGLVDQAVAVADEILASGGVYATTRRGRQVEEVKATPGGALVDVPVVVIVNEYSASASELVAGALQDAGRALVVGAPTFGKGSVQSILELPLGAGMRLTTMRYVTPKGRMIQAKGITPDVVVPMALRGGVPPRERDLDGHLSPRDGLPLPIEPRPAAPGAPAPSASVALASPVPPKDPPDDPRGGADAQLARAFELLRERLPGR
ncbi:MAG: S41 family peptidase [Polyangiaceae bacterium]|nr:S41 family peptidase [Polyangiaceae bacterium]